MGHEARLAAVAGATLLLGVALAGCITVFPAKDAVTSDPRANSMTYLPVIAFEHQEDPPPGPPPCVSGTDSSTVFVPQHTKSVTLDIHVHMTSISEPFASAINHHLDFTVADGDGVKWADIHLDNNGTDKKLTIDGPKPGGWTVSLVWNVCNENLIVVNVNDDFHITMVLLAPV